MGSARLELSAKVIPPESRGLVRERLLGELAARLGLILAPAGYGKTRLLGQMATTFGGAVAWYRIDAGDRRSAAFVAHLGKTLLRSMKIDSQPDSMEDLLAVVEAATRDQPALLIVDDFHELAGTDSEQAFVRLVGLAPPSLRILIAARRWPGLDVPAMRLSGDVVVLDAEDLRFRSWEVERLFRDVYGEPLRPEDAAALTRRTEGWAAGLAMFHLLTAGRSPAERHQALGELARGPRLVRAYLVREVLSELPPDLRDFLRRTSALGLLTGELCDSLLGRTGSGALLEDLEQRQLFTSADDGGRSFRYHQVLQDHLELELTEQLGRAQARQWYGRAGRILQVAGEVRASFRAYARAEDWASVGQLLLVHGAEIVAQPLDAVTDLLPVDLWDQDPWLVLAGARRLASRGSLARAVVAYRQAEDHATDMELAALCREERRHVAQWLPDGDPIPRDWAGVIRSATKQNPAQARRAAAAVGGPEGRLAAGVAALLAAQPEQADALFREVAEHPESGPRMTRLAAFAISASRLLTGCGADLAPSELESLVLGADVNGCPWWARVGRALMHAELGDSTALALVHSEADTDEDAWGAALIRLLHGLTSRDAEMLDDATARFTALGAPVLRHWAACFAAAVDGDPASHRVRQADDAGKAAGIRSGLHAAQRWSADRPAVGSPPPQLPATNTTPFRLRVLGGFELVIDGVPVDVSVVRPRVRAALRMLARHAGASVHRDVLVNALWPDAEPEAGHHSLQVAVSSLRHLIEPGVERGRSVLLPRLGDAYSLAVPPDGSSDLLDFEAALAAARSARFAGEPANYIAALRTALDCYGGDLLPEDGPAEWVVHDRERLRLAAADAAESVARAETSEGDNLGAIDHARRSLWLDPYRDSAWRLLIELHETCGDAAAAHTARAQHRRVLTELGLTADAASKRHWGE